MKLSDAIRLGAMLNPQIRKYLRLNGKTCALGAACDAVGIQKMGDSDRELHALFVEFPFLHSAAKCPACSLVRGKIRRLRGDEYDVEDVIIHLNDDHKWTRERIADWVESVQPPVNAPAQGQATAQALVAVDRVGAAEGRSVRRA